MHKNSVISPIVLESSIENLNYIAFTAPAIKFDQNNFNFEINNILEPVKQLGDNLEKEQLKITLTALRKFKKEISDRRITIVKEINKPITEFEKQIKSGNSEIDIYINKYETELNIIEAKEKTIKGEKICIIIKEACKKYNLISKYTEQLIIYDEYYLQKWTLNKLESEINNLAEALFKQQDYDNAQFELRNTQIESRTHLIEKLNLEYNFNFTYVNYPIENYNDEEVSQNFMKKYDGKLKEELKNKTPVAHIDETIQILENRNNKPTLTYQNLRIGAATQIEIMQIIAKFKAAGLFVEFI